MSVTLFSQTDAISYQAVILNPRTQEIPGVDAESNILPNKVIAMRFTILRLNGTVDYQETQLPMTDAYGLVNLFIGEGTQTSVNDFDEIEWDGESKNLQVEIDFNAGVNFRELGTQKLTYVPYAYHRNITASGNLTVDGESLLQSNLQVLENTNLEGDLTVEGAVQFNADFGVTGDTTFDGNITINGTTDLNENLNVVGVTNLNDALNVDGVVQFNNDFNVTGDTTIDGNLIVNGSTDLNENLNVVGVTNLNDALNVVGGAILENTLTVNEATILNNTLNVLGETNLENNLIVNGDSQLDAALNVVGETNLNNILTVTGATTLEDDFSVEGNAVLANLIVRGNGAIKGKHIAWFKNSEGGDADGIAIQIDQSNLSMANNFITFYAEDISGQPDHKAGRIESFDASEDTWGNFPAPRMSDFYDLSSAYNAIFDGGSWPGFDPGRFPTLSGGQLPSANMSGGSWIAPTSFPHLHFNKGRFPRLSGGEIPTLDFGAAEFPEFHPEGFFDIPEPSPIPDISDMLSPMVTWASERGFLGIISITPWEVAVNAAKIGALQLARDQGVIYGSKGADYAEWLEKENPNEEFIFGTVVGVKDGKISKITEGADQVMSISRNPIVLGNMPNDGEEAKFEKVGFLGQVPVLVIGHVSEGDYIVASGYNDGYAIAIKPSNFSIENVHNLIGKAWSSSEGRKLSFINVSVGLNNKEWVNIVKLQDQKITNLDEKVQELQSLIQRVEKLEAQNLILK